jgi:hypothetical protein
VDGSISIKTLQYITAITTKAENKNHEKYE